MVRKRNKNRKKSNPAKADAVLSVEALTERTKQALQKGNFKEAISHCKALVKDEASPARLALLAEAYYGRACALADKGMHKEAVLIWRNRAEFCAMPLAEPLFFRLLAAAGQLDEALALFNEQRDRLEQAGQLTSVRELFAALAIAGFDPLLSQLPTDDPVVVDYPAAQAALQAYCEGDDETVQQQLKTIPFRSPFRDLRQLLKALISTTAESRSKLIQRIPDNSAFISLAQAFRASLLPDEALLARLDQQTPQSRAFILALKGWQSQQALINELTQLDNPPSTEVLIRLAARHRQTLGTTYVEQLTERLAIHSPNTYTLLKRTKSKLSSFALALAEAHRAERNNAHPVTVFENLIEAIELMKTELQAGTNPEAKPILALLYRHMHELEQKHNAPEDVLRLSLERIIHYDPEDKGTYLQLIPALRQAKQLKQARTLLEQALNHFPDDMAILTEAVETALASNAFKKAATIGRQILAKDPINQRVRQALIDAHLAHSRKLIKQGKYALAEKELQQAGEWAKSPTDCAKVELVDGVLQFKQKNYDKAAQYFKSLPEKLGGALCGRFFLLLELNKQQCTIAPLLKQCELEKTLKNIELPDLQALLNHLDGSLKNEQLEHIQQSFKHLKSKIKQCARLPYTFDEGIRICETLQRYQCHELRQHYAKTALKRWRHAPIYVYHELDAESQLSYGLSDKAYDRLERALERADNDGDKRTIFKLEGLIDCSPFDDGNEGDFNPFEDPAMPPIDILVDLMIQSLSAQELKRFEREMGGRDAMRQHLKQLIETQGLEGFPDLAAISEGSENPKNKKHPNNPKQSEFF